MLYLKKKKTRIEIYEEYVGKILASLNPIRGIISGEISLEFEVCALLCICGACYNLDIEKDANPFIFRCQQLTETKYGFDINALSEEFSIRCENYLALHNHLYKPACLYLPKKPDTINLWYIALFCAFGDFISSPDSVSKKGAYPNSYCPTVMEEQDNIRFNKCMAETLDIYGEFVEKYIGARE